MLHRELPVSVPFGEGILEGVIDCLFLDGDELVLVDYKTDVLERVEDVAVGAARYRMQVGAYALAISQVLSRPVDRCVLIFLAPSSGALEYEVPDLDEAVETARQKLMLEFSRS